MAKKRSDTYTLSMRIGQNRTQVSDKGGDHNKADLVLAIQVSKFANKGDLIRAIDVLRGRADNMDWPPFSNRASTEADPGCYGAEALLGAGPEPAGEPETPSYKLSQHFGQ